MRAVTAITVLALAAGCGGSESQDEPGRAGDAPPSILLVSIDTLRSDHLGLYGYERDTSPYLDRLAAESLVFDRAYTTAPWTLVAHMSMFTGLEPDEHGVTSATLALSPDVAPVAQRLRDRGYRTLGFRAEVCTWMDPKFGFGRGFDVYAGHAGPADAERRIAAELDRTAADRPVFVFLHLFDVHTALFDPGFRGFYDPPPPFDTQFLPDARERLAGVDCAKIWETRGKLPPDQLEAMVALYDGGIRYVDSELERIVEGWRKRGLLERSLLIVTADHGEGLCQRDLIGGHGGMNEEGLRIPLLVRFPDGYRAGEREQGLVSVLDYAPTILAAAGLDAEPGRAGTTLRGTPDAERILRATRALISQRWKTVREGEEVLVFDLAADEAELHPRTESDPEFGVPAKDLRARYWTERNARPARVSPAVNLEDLDPAEQERLRALGYAGVLDDGQ